MKINEKQCGCSLQWPNLSEILRSAVLFTCFLSGSTGRGVRLYKRNVVAVSACSFVGIDGWLFCVMIHYFAYFLVGYL